MADPNAGSLGVKDGDEAITLAPYSCTSEEKTVSLEKDCLVVVRKVLDSGWVYVVAVNNESKAGYFPGAYLKKVDPNKPPSPAVKAAPLPEPISPKRPSHVGKPVPPVPTQPHASPSSGVPKPKTPSRALPPSPGDRDTPPHVAPRGGSVAAPLPPSSGEEGKEGNVGLAEFVGEANNRFQDYVMMMSRLTNKYKVSLEAQTKLMDANNDLAICVHEFGKKLASTLEEDSGEEKLGTCMMKISEVLMAQERLKSRQRAAEQEMMQHFMDFLKVSAPRIRSQKNTFDIAQQEYLDSSLRLREMGMKSKTKLENIKEGEKEKAEKKSNYHNMTLSLLETLGASAHQENATLLSLFSKWLESASDVAGESSQELARDVTHTRMWKEGAETEKRFSFFFFLFFFSISPPSYPFPPSSLIAQEKGKFSDLLGKPDTKNAPGVTLLGAHPSFSMRSTQDPVQKLLDRLIRNEKKYVHTIVSTQVFFFSIFFFFLFPLPSSSHLLFSHSRTSTLPNSKKTPPSYPPKMNEKFS